MDTFFVLSAALVVYAVIAATVTRQIINSARRNDAAAYERQALEVDIFAYFRGMLWPAWMVGLLESVCVMIGTRIICALFAAGAWLARRPVLTAVVASVEAPLQPAATEINEFVQAPMAVQPAVMELPELNEEPVAPVRKSRARKPAGKKTKAAE